MINVTTPQLDSQWEQSRIKVFRFSSMDQQSQDFTINVCFLSFSLYVYVILQSHKTPNDLRLRADTPQKPLTFLKCPRSLILYLLENETTSETIFFSRDRWKWKRSIKKSLTEYAKVKLYHVHKYTPSCRWTTFHSENNSSTNFLQNIFTEFSHFT